MLPILSLLSEWEKAVATTLLGFATGIAAEPLKHAVSDFLVKPRLRRLCYKELYHVRESMTAVLTAIDQQIPYGEMSPAEYSVMMVTGLNIGGLKYVAEKESTTFYQLDVAVVAAQIIYLKENVQGSSGLKEMTDTAKARIRLIDCAVEDGRLDGRLLTGVAASAICAERKRFTYYRRNADPLHTACKNASPFEIPFRYRPIVSMNILRIRRLKQLWKNFNEEASPGRVPN